jgi:ribosomal protein L7Ae-like RNA K-turn-binding protein
MAETSHPRELSDAEMREWVATVRRGVATGVLLAQSNSQDEIVRHLEEERRRLNR